MKFQNCISINFVTDTQMDQWMHTHMDKPKAICPFNFSKVGGIKKDFVMKGVQWLSGRVLNKTEGPRVGASPASLHRILEQDTLILA